MNFWKNDQIQILILSFVIAIILISVAPDTETAIISITVIWGFLSINNGLLEYKNYTKQMKELYQDDFVTEKSNLAGDINDSNLDALAEKFDSLNPDQPINKAMDEENNNSLEYLYNDNDIMDDYKYGMNRVENYVESPRSNVLSQASERTANNTYDAEGEYTPDKIGYMRYDMERRTRDLENYTNCYKPLKGETNDCLLYSNMGIDESQSEYWRQRGLRNKKRLDGTGSKTVEYYRTHFNTELEQEEKKVWWEVEDTF